MGTKNNPRRKGTGGLWIRKQRRWNEVKGDFDIVELFQAAKEIKDPDKPGQRKWVTGTWISYRKQRDANLPPGILQGLPAEVFTKMISSDESSYEVDLDDLEIVDPFIVQLYELNPQEPSDKDLTR